MLKFIVVSDLHIVPEGKLSHGLDTTARLQSSIDYINAHHGDAEFVVFAGDLADHGERPAYERFKSTISTLDLPAYLTLGNHDDRATFLDVFGSDQAATTGNMDHVIDRHGYRMIVLDSCDKQAGHAGALEDQQLDWLAEQLASAQDTPVIIVLHHNITKLHVQTDTIILQDNARFAQVLSTHPDIRQVISGHVHMTTSGTYRGIPFCTLSGGHYQIEPTLLTRSGPEWGTVPRREGPGQLAVVLADDDSVVVHMENFLDRHLVLANELFTYSD